MVLSFFAFAFRCSLFALRVTRKPFGISVQPVESKSLALDGEVDATETAAWVFWLA